MTLDDDDRAALDADIAVLQQGSRTWSNLSLAQRATLLRALRTSVSATGLLNNRELHVNSLRVVGTSCS